MEHIDSSHLFAFVLGMMAAAMAFVLGYHVGARRNKIGAARETLSERDWEKLREDLKMPPEPNDDLKRLFGKRSEKADHKG